MTEATKASDWIVKPALVCDLDGTIRYNKNDPEAAMIADHGGQLCGLDEEEEDG